MTAETKDRQLRHSLSCLDVCAARLAHCVERAMISEWSGLYGAAQTWWDGAQVWMDTARDHRAALALFENITVEEI